MELLRASWKEPSTLALHPTADLARVTTNECAVDAYPGIVCLHFFKTSILGVVPLRFLVAGLSSEARKHHSGGVDSFVGKKKIIISRLARVLGSDTPPRNQMVL